MRISIISFLIIFLFAQCNQTEKPTTTATKTTTTTPPAVPPLELPAPSKEFLLNVYNNCDYVDIIMYFSNYSMNVSQKNSIQMLVNSWSLEPAIITADCPAQGRLFFLKNAKTITEADLHFTDGVCHAMVFYVDGKKTYSTKLSQQGIDMFAGYFENAEKLQSKATNPK